MDLSELIINATEKEMHDNFRITNFIKHLSLSEYIEFYRLKVENKNIDLKKFIDDKLEKYAKDDIKEATFDNELNNQLLKIKQKPSDNFNNKQPEIVAADSKTGSVTIKTGNKIDVKNTKNSADNAEIQSLIKNMKL